MQDCCGLMNRRRFLQNAGGGFGMIALASLLAEQGLLASESESLSPTRSTPRLSKVTLRALRHEPIVFGQVHWLRGLFDLFAPERELRGTPWFRLLKLCLLVGEQPADQRTRGVAQSGYAISQSDGVAGLPRREGIGEDTDRHRKDEGRAHTLYRPKNDDAGG